MFLMVDPKWTNFIVNKPPTLYSIMESIVNYGKDDKTKIKDLADASRETIFNFNYPLSTHILKKDFEIMILNHFIDRRIGFETMTLFRIKLNVKLNEIMPVYNKMFDMLENWDIFSDGEELTRIASDSRNINTSNTQEIDSTNTNSSQSSTTTQNTSQTSSSSTKDNRKSDTPQALLSEVRDGQYVSDYEYNTNTGTGSDSNTGTATGSSSATNTEDRNITSEGETTNIGNLQETIKKSPADKLKLYEEFIEKRQHIYSMIFKELECLFYQLA